MERRIVCAAIAKDGRVMLGARHFDAFMLDDAKYFFGNTECLKDGERGFVDNKGQFLNFNEALDIVYKAGQIIEGASNCIEQPKDKKVKQSELIAELLEEVV